MAIEHLKCPSCGAVNPAGATACRECGTSFATPYVAPAAVVPEDTVVVHRSGVSQSAVAVMVVLGLVALAAVALLMYQWGRTDTEEDLAKARTERSRTEPRPAPLPTTTTPPPATAPAPIVVPAPSAPPVTVTVPPTTTVAPAPSSSQSAGCAAYTTRIEPLLREWSDLRTSVETASGPVPADVIERMQDVERRVSRLSAPACAGRAQGHLLTAMTSMIDALKTAPGDAPPTSSAAFQQAEELFRQFETDYDALRAA